MQHFSSLTSNPKWGKLVLINVEGKMSERGAKAAEVVQVLTAARQTISDPKHWVKEAFCSGGDSESVDVLDYGDFAEGERVRYTKATNFCALGAIRRNNVRAIGFSHEEAEHALAAFSPCKGSDDAVSVYGYNDAPRTTHADILALFDLAIEQQCKIVREEAEKEWTNWPDDSHLPDEG